jgi:hypothetical protein
MRFSLAWAISRAAVDAGSRENRAATTDLPTLTEGLQLRHAAAGCCGKRLRDMDRQDSIFQKSGKLSLQVNSGQSNTRWVTNSQLLGLVMLGRVIAVLFKNIIILINDDIHFLGCFARP